MTMRGFFELKYFHKEVTKETKRSPFVVFVTSV